MGEPHGPQEAPSLNLSWDQFHEDARRLAGLLAKKGPFALLIAVTRGGLAPAAIVARELDLRCIETISIASYMAEAVGGEDGVEGAQNIKGENRLVKTIAPDVLAQAKGKILVIDDLADTGETLVLLRKLLPDAHFATLYVKPQAKGQVDTFAREVSQETWINFPWDLMLAFAPPLVSST